MLFHSYRYSFWVLFLSLMGWLSWQEIDKFVLANSIVPARDNTETKVTIDGTNYNISGGRRSLDSVNLFHSFERFGLNAAEIANFLAQPNIENILARVNGGDPSIINGLIQVTGGNSHLYLMNPAGIIFGSGASLNVSGDFFATTATGIGFEDGNWFQAWGENDYQSLLGMPSRFAFDTSQPAPIVNAGNLAANAGNNINLLAGSIINLGTISTEGGNIIIAAIPGTNWVKISHEGSLLSLEVPTEAIATGFNPLKLPELLTTPEVREVISLEQEEAIASFSLNLGDISIAGQITGKDVHLAANEIQILPSEVPLIRGEGLDSAKSVTLFSRTREEPLASVFIDATVSDYQTLLYGGKSGTRSIAIAREENGIAVIGEELSHLEIEGKKVDEIHIISEGNTGNFWLGNAFVSGNDFTEYREDFANWRSALGANADILLYSCFTALGDVGDVLLNNIARETGADVAASTNLTGNNEVGGNWILEKQIGTIEANIAFTDSALDAYTDTLNILTVTSSADSGMGALRNTITNAANGDEIRFSTNMTIFLNSELSINNQTLIIDGTTNNIILDGQSSDRIFFIDNNSSVTLNNLTIQNGRLGANGGAGIYVKDSTLTINDSIITNNSAVDDGGGIFIKDSIATINNSTISGNTISGSNLHGGGIASQNSTLTVESSTISGNVAIGGGVSGAGISLRQTDAAIDNSTISGNSAGGNGGGIFMDKGTVILENSTISQNSSNSDGGGIRLDKENFVTIENVTISGNSAKINGGGVDFDSKNEDLSLSIVNTTIFENRAGGEGGGIYMQNSGGGSAEVSVLNSIIAGNSAGNSTTNDTIDDNNIAIADLGYNLIGVDGTGDFTNNNTRVGVSTTDLNLSPLGNYGGLTQTHALLPGSIAIDAGTSLDAPSVDQRAFSREIIDIGAFEVNADLEVILSVDSGGILIEDTVTATLDLINHGPDAVGDIHLQLSFPNEIQLQNFILSMGSYNPSTGIWIVGELDGNYNTISADTSATLDLSFEVPINLSLSLDFTANILSFNGEELDSSNNSSIANQTSPSLVNCLPICYPDNLLNSISAIDTLANYQTLISNRNLGLSLLDTGVEQFEQSMTEEFSNYLDLKKIDTTSLSEIQEILQNIAQKTGTKPSIIYVMFAPAVLSQNPSEMLLASSESLPSGDRNWESPQPANTSDSDILQVFLVTANGEVVMQQLPEATRERVMKQAGEFRNTVTNVRRPQAFLTPSRQFYQWIIAPLERELEAREIDNIAFILHAGLRSLPMAALHDGEAFLIERYSMGLMPSISLTDTTHKNIKETQVLAMGASEFSEQDALPAVPVELDIIGQFWQGDVFLNEEFTVEQLKGQRQQTAYGIVHLGTHGEFRAGKSDRSYILFGDRQVSLDRMRELNFHNPTTELLVLSACRTALGDVEAELGFAGLAVAAGVKSALGSLWNVNDAGTLALMGTFYSRLRDVPIKVGALRQAQLAMLRGETYLKDGSIAIADTSIPLTPELVELGDRSFSHPYYWSGFTLIGSPW
ncbi:MAG: CHAT domain-containing protein [Cyanobacteria bacterium SBLK]|nr:CHAT domain-containing protein [Cyanobacteria bacterium SBLK]